MIPDSILLLAICIPVMLFVRGPLRLCAAAMLGSFVMVVGYEWLTGGYAVDGAYIVADIACASWLTIALLHHETHRPSLLVAAGFWVCCMIHGLKLMGMDLQSYWWALRVVNLCQLLTIGGGFVLGGGKHSWRLRPLLGIGMGRIHGLSAPFRAQDR